jgi:hypothetical protein
MDIQKGQTKTWDGNFGGLTAIKNVRGTLENDQSM